MSLKSTLKNLKPSFSGHETFPMRYGWLKKIFDECHKIETQNGLILKELFNNKDAITLLGVGKNMVASMRYWAIRSGLLLIDGRNLIINNRLKYIFEDDGVDPWLENTASLWLIHWHLSTDPRYLTYYWFFNFSNSTDFDKELLSHGMNRFFEQNDIAQPHEQTLHRDIECFLHIYSPKSNKEPFNEESIESPLTELGLVSPKSRRKFYQVKRGYKANISIYTFIFVLLQFWKYHSPHSPTLALDAICYEEKSPGKIFMLTVDDVYEFTEELSTASEQRLQWSETAGLKQVILNKSIDLEETAYEIFKRNYK